MSYKILGDYIRKVDNKNKDTKVLNLQGLSMSKEFRKSTSNIVGTDLSKYKIVKQGQFCCDFMSVIRVHKLPVVFNNLGEDVIISPAYVVFEVIDENLLLPEYLMLWFRRTEFDRYADFRCDSSIRGGFQWEELCEVELPIPSIEKQREIVAQYQAVENKIKVNEQICEKLEATAQTLFKQWFVDFEFPITKESHPELVSGSHPQTYKSSGGSMVYNQELKKEIPEGWEVKSLGEVVHYKKGYAFKSHDYESAGISIIRVSDLGSKYINHSNFFKIPKNDLYKDFSVIEDDIIITTVGSWPSNPLSVVGKVIRVPSFAKGYYLNQNMVRFRINSDTNENVYQQLVDNKFSEYLLSGAQGSANQASITLEHIFNYKIILTAENKLNNLLNQYYRYIDNNINQNQKLTQLQSLLLSRLAALEG